MAIIKVTFENQINISVQPTDILYGVKPHSTTQGFQQAGKNNIFGENKPVKIGKITEVDHDTNEVSIDNTNFPAFTIDTDTFLFFSKDRRVNSSGLLGYYSLVEYRNASKKKAEIFAVGTEYAPSSK